MIQNWASDFTKTIETLRNPHFALQMPPIDGTPDERLKALVDAREALGLGRSPKEASEFATGLFRDQTKESLSDNIGRLVLDIDEGIASALRDGASDPRVIATSDFGDGSGVCNLNEVIIAYGQLDTLPGDHLIRQRLTAEECYQLNLGGYIRPVILLGRLRPFLVGQQTPLPWYTLEDAVQRTTNYRGQQRRQEQEREREEQAIVDKSRWEKEYRDNLPENKIRHLEQQLAKLQESTK